MKNLQKNQSAIGPQSYRLAEKVNGKDTYIYGLSIDIGSIMYTTKTSETSDNAPSLYYPGNNLSSVDTIRKLSIDSSDGWFNPYGPSYDGIYQILSRNTINPSYTLQEGVHKIFKIDFRHSGSMVSVVYNHNFTYRGSKIIMDSSIKLGNILSAEYEYIDDYILTSIEILDGVVYPSRGKTLKFINQYGY